MWPIRGNFRIIVMVPLAHSETSLESGPERTLHIVRFKVPPGERINKCYGTVSQALCFMAGANSIFTGEKLLTTPNNDYDQDQQMFKTLGESRESDPVCFSRLFPLSKGKNKMHPYNGYEQDQQISERQVRVQEHASICLRRFFLFRFLPSVSSGAKRAEDTHSFPYGRFFCAQR
jgi:hypothetical protein